MRSRRANALGIMSVIPTRVRLVADASAERLTAFLRAVYGWMFVGLAITAVIAAAIASTPAFVQAVASNPLLFVSALVAELGVVFYLSARVQKLTPNAATILFLLYATLNGVTLSVLTVAYSTSAIATTFAVTAGMFGALAVFGSRTKRSLAGAGQFFYMGLIGLVLASVLRLFWHNDALEFLISVVGVIVFTGLTAWDAQRLKQMAAGPQAVSGSYAILGALSLYLNFINLFLILLRVQGGRRT
jgi:FtsH-binding integral membrane protein